MVIEDLSQYDIDPEAFLSGDVGDIYELVKIPVLSSQEERDLFSVLEEVPDNEAVKKRIIGSNLKLVLFMALKYITWGRYNGFQLMDLFREGYLGLYRAMEDFDISTGYKFSTYACWWIRNRMQRAVMNKGTIIRLPVHLVGETRKFKRKETELFQLNGKNPTIEQIAAHLQISLEKARKLHEVMQNTLVSSLEQPLTRDKGPEDELTF